MRGAPVWHLMGANPSALPVGCSEVVPCPAPGESIMKQSSLRALSFGLLVLSIFFCGALRADEDAVKDFKKYFKKFKDTPTRVEAVLTLEGNESASVVDALVPLLKGKEPEVIQAVVRVLASFEERPPIDALLVALETKKNEPIRVGILQALTAGSYSGTKEALLVCLPDKSWEVRRRAVQAIAAAAYADTADQLLPLCSDSEIAVQCAALEALSALKSELVLVPGTAALEHESWQVRVSAIEALGNIRSKESIGPLISLMEREQGRLIEDVANALANITGRNFGQRTAQWRKFWDTYGDRYEIPTGEALAKLREKQKAVKNSYKPPGGVSYHGIESPSRSIVFVIDVSGSMETEVIERERFEDGEYPSFKRIDIVKTELMRTIENLEEYVEFNIYSFATDVKSWKKKQVKANVVAKKSALDWIKRLEAIGGNSKQDLAAAGLGGSANLSAGKTNTYSALMTALGVGAKKKGKDVTYTVKLDTIFFLSDGRPSHGKFVVPEDILREVRTANELRKIVLHTIAIGQFTKTFMRGLAEQNGGVFVDLGN